MLVFGWSRTQGLTLGVAALLALAIAVSSLALAASPQGTNSSEVSHTAGLEEWFDYESVETGAGSRAHVNLATGNLVWHTTPLINRGRGLSTFLNLTYTVQDKGGQGVGNAGGNEANGPNYQQAGQNFSLGISGPTRLSDPLVAPKGNGGTITLYDADGTRHIFKKAADGVTFTAPPGVHLHLRRFSDSDPDKRWAMTRPDGITHFFDEDGYQSTIEDRNANVIRFTYEPLKRGNGSPQKRVVKVTDSSGVVDSPAAANRSVIVRYGSDDRISEIEDHGGRKLRFAYDTRGFLRSLTEAAGTPVERVTRFDYSGTGQNLDLSAITDPRGNITRVAYDGTGSKKRVASITNRRNNTTGFAYEDTQGNGPSAATVTDPRGFATRHELDATGRPVKLTDARGTVMALTWDEDNNPTRIVAAAGSPDEAVTDMTYNANGLLTSTTDGQRHRTELRYRDGAGTILNPIGTDKNLTFVSDLVSYTKPKGTATATEGDFTERYDPDAKGNVLSRTNAEGFIARTTYDARGQVTREQDEVGNVTTYRDFDPSGLPREQTDPRGGVYHYRYDAVANTTAVVDPRNPAATGDTFTTRLTYDALDRLVSERIPKDSRHGAFVTKRHEFDANSNQTASVDGTGARGEKSFTAMDDVEEHRTPATAHFGEAGAATEVSKLLYDADDNLVSETRPNGTRTDIDGDFSTAYTYDEVGQRTAEIRRSRGDGPASDLATSFAYDRRGNVIGVVDPKRNAQFGGDPAANATVDERRRLTYRYDRADNRIFAAEDPAGLNLRRELRYDANDNKVAEVGPRGFAGGADPAKFTETLDYDQRDLLVARTDAKGRRETYQLRGDGKLVRETKPKGTATATPGDYETSYDYLPTGELKSWSLPEAADQYAGGKGTVVYERDPVGNPTRITDARGKSFASTFLDTGDVASTERPSWWQLKGPAVAEKSPEELMRGGDASGQKPHESDARDETSGDLGNVEPEPLPSLLPKAGQARFGYDDALRLTSVIDIAGNSARIDYDARGRATSMQQPFADGRPIVQRFAFDRNGNLRQERDGEDIATTYGYDQFDRKVRTTAPGTTDQPEEVTLDTFDANGNIVVRQLPRGAPTTWRAAYDAVDRLVSQANPASETTTYAYDEAGNQVSERSPRGNLAGLSEQQRAGFTTSQSYDEADQLTSRRDGLGNEWRFGYDADGNQERVDAPGAKRAADADVERQLTVRTFDGRDLPWSETTGAGEHERTRVREFDGNGNLRREVNPRGVDPTTKLPRTTDDGEGAVSRTSLATKHATVREFSADNLLTSIHLPWGERDAQDRKRFRQDFLLDARGRVQSIDAPYDWTDSAAKAGRTSYTHYDNGWIKTTSDQEVVDPDTGHRVYEQLLSYDYDRRGLQTLWRSSVNREMTRAYFPNGKLREREASAPAQDGKPAVSRRYTYRYNPNGSLITINDLEKSRVTRMDYDVAERKRYVDEDWTRGKDTKFDYDANGNITGRRTDGELTGEDRSGYDGGKLTTYEFDVLDREAKMTVDPAGTAANRVSTTEYWPSGDKAKRSKANKVTETWFFANDGRPVRNRRHTDGAPQDEFVKDQEYRYDANGNRSRDERGDHEFNSRDQHVQWRRSADYGQTAGSIVSYEVNGSGAIAEKDDDGITTRYKYSADRLLTATTGGSVSRYHYDPFGNVKKIENGSEAAEFQYDEFERMTKATGDGTSTSEYEYDGLDRRDSETTDGKTQDFAYVGTTDQLSQERDRSGSKTEDYDYDATEDLVGRATGQVGAETQGSYKDFGKDVNGSVEGLEEFDGTIKPGNQYLYDPYGKIENESNIQDGPAKDNPFRFESFYYDSGIKQYDMRARNYRPEIGRFTSQDRFESASKDFNLQADPLTQNRYAFAGGNPVNRVEFDGHFPSPRDIGRGAKKLGRDALKNPWVRGAGIGLAVAGGLAACPFTVGGGCAAAGAAAGVGAGVTLNVANQAVNEKDHSGKAFAKAGGGGVMEGLIGAVPVGGAARILGALKGAKAAKNSLKLPASQSWGRADTLADHFSRHGADFGAKSADDYARKASEFLQQSQRQGVATKVDGTTIRVYDRRKNIFGSYNADGTTKTFFKPNPRKHGYSSNDAYWNAQPGTFPWSP